MAIGWLIFILLSAVFSSIATIYKKKALLKEHATEFSAVFKIFQILFLLCLIPFLNINLHLPIRIYLFVYLLSLGVTIQNIFTSKALRHMEISTVIPLHNLQPLFTVFAAIAFLNEKLTPKHFLGIFIILIGAYILEVEHHLRHLTQPIKKLLKSKYVSYLILAFGVAAIKNAGEKYAISQLTPITLLLLIYIFTTANLLLIHSILYDGIRGIIKGIKKCGGNICMASIFANLSNLAYFFALSAAYLSYVITIKRFSAVLTTIAGGKFFHEKHLIQKTIACLIMIAGIILVLT
ncbi:MAG TPA: hypothetical protein ENG02_01230 [Candidatus Woesearchaeota archaeon]|nr:hypothetical protein [Candidatus Woesearchaeota archaeon]